MTLDPIAVLALRDRLNTDHAAGRSWRKIAKDYPGVTFQALQKIAVHGVLPKDRKVLQALGLLAEPDEAAKYRRRFKMTFTRLLKELRY